jgi:hypothetical protein
LNNLSMKGGWMPRLSANVVLAMLVFTGWTAARAQVEEQGAFRSNLGLLDELTRETVIQLADSLQLSPGEPVTIYSSTWHEANWFIGSMLAQVLAGKGYEVHILEVAMPPAGGGQENGKTRMQAANQGAEAQEQTQQEQPSGGELNEAAQGDTTGAYADSVAAAEDESLFKTEKKPDTPAVQKQAAPHPAAEPVREEHAAFKPGAYPKGQVLDLRVLEFGVTYCDINRVMLFGPVRFTRIGGVYVEVSQLKGPSGSLADVVTAERHKVDRLSGAQRSMAEGASYPFSAPEMKAPSLGRYIEPTVVVAIVSSLVYLFYKNQH